MRNCKYLDLSNQNSPQCSLFDRLNPIEKQDIKRAYEHFATINTGSLKVGGLPMCSFYNKTFIDFEKCPKYKS
jgi:hypothetical protein